MSYLLSLKNNETFFTSKRIKIYKLKHTTMIKGTDIDYMTNKLEGYPMIQYDGRFKFDVNKEYRIFCYFPAYCKPSLKGLRTNVNYSFTELVKLYLDEKEVDSLCETYNFVDFKNPSYTDFLNLANDIMSYSGLD